MMAATPEIIMDVKKPQKKKIIPKARIIGHNVGSGISSGVAGDKVYPYSFDICSNLDSSIINSLSG
jgi:hypothetical protein